MSDSYFDLSSTTKLCCLLIEISPYACHPELPIRSRFFVLRNTVSRQDCRGIRHESIIGVQIFGCQAIVLAFRSFELSQKSWSRQACRDSKPLEPSLSFCRLQRTSTEQLLLAQKVASCRSITRQRHLHRHRHPRRSCPSQPCSEALENLYSEIHPPGF